MMAEQKPLGVNKDSPLYLESQKPQIMHLKYQNYGLRKLQKRLKNNGISNKNVR
jgi:hypothetical protein